MIPINDSIKHELHLEKAMFSVWLKSSGETNEIWMDHLKKCIRVAIKEALTEKQREYLNLYMSGYNVIEIAQVCEVNPSTVSRTLNRAIQNLIDKIKYATPRTLIVDRKVKRTLTRLYRK